MPSSGGIWLAALALLASTATDTVTATRDQPPAYWDLVRVYAHGGNEAEVALQEKERIEAHGSGGDGAWLRSAQPEDPLLRAALAFHCELAFRALLSGRISAIDQHLQLAWAAVNARPLALTDLRERALRRQAWLVMIWIADVREAEDQEERFLDRARDEFPRDTDILLASGVHTEHLTIPLSRSSIEPLPSIGAGRFSRDKANIARAAQYYRDAIAADPFNMEARARLARVRLISGDGNDARKDLTEAQAMFDRLDDAARQDARRAEFLIRLLLARLASDAQEWPAALREYTRAGSLCRAAQAAYVGRAYVALMMGDEAQARAVAEAMLTPSNEAASRVDPCDGDPWADYQYGGAWRIIRAARRLREAVRP